MEFGPKIIHTFSDNIPIIGGFRLTETLTTMWIITAILMIGSVLLTRNLQKVPGKVQTWVELFVDTIYNLTSTNMGSKGESFAPYIGTLILFLAVSNLTGLVAIRPPTADLNTTVSLAAITFFLIHYHGVKTNGFLGYLKGYTEPFFLLTPINVIGDLATPISMSFRLFGNLVGGLIITGLAYAALGSVKFFGIPILQIGAPIVLHAYMDIFSGLLQTLVFAMLTMLFVGKNLE